MPKITETKREERRQQILDAALRCFSRDGFHATTTADIVRESGLSQGALYLYFATKDDIVVALADDRHQGEVFLNALAQSEQDPVQGLMLLIELYGKGLTDQRRLDTVQGVVDLFRGVARKVMILTGHGTQAADLPEQPLGGLDPPADVPGNEQAGLLGQIEQDGAGLEHPDRRRTAAIHQRRYLGVRVH